MSVIEPPQRHALLVDDERRSAFFVLRMPTLKRGELQWAQMPQRLSAATIWIARKRKWLRKTTEPFTRRRKCSRQESKARGSTEPLRIHTIRGRYTERRRCGCSIPPKPSAIDRA